MEKIKINLNEFNKLIDTGFTIQDLAKHFNCSRWKINDFRTKNNIQRNFRENFPYKLSDTQISVLYGALLGDGCLNNVKLGNSYFSYASSEVEHTWFIGKFFQDNLIKCCENAPFVVETYDKRTEKNYISYRIHSSCNITYQNIRDVWYKEGGKTIPKNLILNPLICLIWYLGDGHLGKKNKRASSYIKLSTDGFNPEDVKMIITQLKDFSAYIRYRNKEKTQSAIIIPKVKIKEFLKYIGDCPIECYRYKWDYKPSKSDKIEEYGVGNFVDKVGDFIEDYSNGMKITQISKKYNCDGSLIRYYLKKLNIHIRKDRVRYLLNYNGEEKIITNLKQYCKDNNISYIYFYRFIDKSIPYKGHLCSRIN